MTSKILSAPRDVTGEPTFRLKKILVLTWKCEQSASLPSLDEGKQEMPHNLQTLVSMPPFAAGNLTI